jgi:Cys-tRNA(Pro)/Cys-tRNA(Cys) deacylase
VAGRGTNATIALERAKIPFTLHEYAHDPRSGSYGLEASEALAVPPGRATWQAASHPWASAGGSRS